MSRFRGAIILAAHAVAIALALAAAFFLRFDFTPPPVELRHMMLGICIAVPLKTLVFWRISAFREGSWRFAGIADMGRVALANLAASVFFTAVVRISVGAEFPRSVFVIDFLTCVLATGVLRIAGRVAVELHAAFGPRSGRKGVLIYGAGAAGVSLVREIRSNPAVQREILGFLDDNPRKIGTSLMQVRILGNGRDAPHIVQRLQRSGRAVAEIIVAMPSATGREIREAVANCRAAGVPCRIVPGLSDLLTGKVLSRQIRTVRVDEVLGREPVELDDHAVRAHIRGRSVMVTGAAGSIGSEICRQILRLDAERLVLVDRAESDMYRIELELAGQTSRVQLVTAIADIQDPKRMSQLIQRHSVEMIFHAAAYKHVPMMESHICEAVKNNILGTWNLVNAARQNGVSSFLMISSDKAVRPSSVMGATKRAAELILSSVSDGPTRFVSVRFGNVMGSNGSVIPLFESQIAKGGPVTVTHPDVKRYFMTTREAVQLVLQASAIGRGSEIFVLDMGEQVRILDLARNMIRLAGFEPEEDIDIRIVGMRPGEKLYEELAGGGEDLLPTQHSKIRVCQTVRVSRPEIEMWLLAARASAERFDEAGLRDLLHHIIPEYAEPVEQPGEALPGSAAGSMQIAGA